jgi:hypothetical protein
MKERKLKKKEAMIVSRILEDVNFKYYIEYLLSNKIDKILMSGQNKHEKILMLMGDVMAFILQNMNKAEENIDELIMSYRNININQVNDMDIDEFTSTMKTIFMAGVPNILADYVDLTEVKKKLKELKKNMEKENY